MYGFCGYNKISKHSLIAEYRDRFPNTEQPIKIIKENKKRGIIINIYFYAIILSLSFIAMTFLNPRYFLPVIPVGFILLYAGTEQVIFYIKKYVFNFEKINNNNPGV